MKNLTIYILSLAFFTASLSAEKGIGESVWSYIEARKEAIIQYEKEGGKIADKSNHYLALVEDLCTEYAKKTDLQEKMELIDYFDRQLTQTYAIVAYQADDIDTMNRERKRWQEACVLLMNERAALLATSTNQGISSR